MPACQGDDGWFSSPHPGRPAAKKGKWQRKIIRRTYFYICDFSSSLFAQFHIYMRYIFNQTNTPCACDGHQLIFQEESKNQNSSTLKTSYQMDVQGVFFSKGPTEKSMELVPSNRIKWLSTLVPPKATRENFQITLMQCSGIQTLLHNLFIIYLATKHPNHCDKMSITIWNDCSCTKQLCF